MRMFMGWLAQSIRVLSTGLVSSREVPAPYCPACPSLQDPLRMAGRKEGEGGGIPFSEEVLAGRGDIDDKRLRMAELEAQVSLGLVGGWAWVGGFCVGATMEPPGGKGPRAHEQAYVWMHLRHTMGGMQG